MSNTLNSMTGFGRADGGDEAYRWAWEIRSVNGRGFDCRIRVPSGCERLDPFIRKTVSSAVNRGSVSVNFDLRRAAVKPVASVDEAMLDALADLCRARGEEPRFDQLLSVRGVIGSETEVAEDLLPEARLQQISSDLENALESFLDARKTEGTALKRILINDLRSISDMVSQARALDVMRIEAIRDRFQAQVLNLMPDDASIDQGRLEQEIATLAVKADIREELERLDAHVQAASDLIEKGSPIGRKLDFLAQEFNREANTLCSKSGDVALTRLGLDIKSVVDQFKEQAANVE